MKSVPRTQKEVAGTTGFQTISVTPEIAARWLALNENNRPRNKRTALKYLATMQRGEWELNGQMIIFSKCGVLMDGQHRLSAVVMYGHPVLMDVRFGIERRTFPTLDDGKKRTAADVLDIAGIKNAKNTSAAIRAVISLERGYHSTDFGVSRSPTNEEIVNWYNENPEIYNCVVQAENWYKKSGRLMQTAALAGFYWMFSRKNPEQAFNFLNEVMLGIGLSGNSPAYLLRSFLIRESAAVTQKTSLPVKRAITIKAWNAYREGREIKLLRFRPNLEEFPVIK